MRRLLRLLRVLHGPPDSYPFHLRWSHWRRAHQATARRCHIARRARRLRDGPEPADTPAVAPSFRAQAPLAEPAGDGELTDGQWARVRALLPPPPRLGRPPLRPRDQRTIVDGLLWLVRTGASWRALPARFGSWHTAYTYFRRWDATGVWPRILHALERNHPEDPGGPTREVSL